MATPTQATPDNKTAKATLMFLKWQEEGRAFEFPAELREYLNEYQSQTVTEHERKQTYNALNATSRANASKGKLTATLSGKPGNGTAFDFVLAPLKNQVEGPFPLGSLHLFGGSSGSGKTTLALQMLRAQRSRQTFCGHETFGRSFLVLMQDRSVNELKRTFARMNINAEDVPHAMLTSAEESVSPAAIIEKYFLERGRPEIVLVEGLDMWSADARDMRIVSPLARAIRDVAEYYHIAIIGTVGAPKMKPKEIYAAPRDRLFGSSAWARRADTVWYVSTDEETRDRHSILMLRNGPDEKTVFTFANGLLVPTEPVVKIGEQSEEQRFELWASQQTVPFTVAAAAKQFNRDSNDRSVRRWIERLTKNGILKRSTRKLPATFVCRALAVEEGQRVTE